MADDTKQPRQWRTEIVVALIALMGVLGAAFIGRLPERETNRTTPDPVVSPVTKVDEVAWASDWLTINETTPFLGAPGVRATNRSRYLARLEHLSLATDPSLRAMRDSLVLFVRDAPPYNDAFYDMIITDALASSFDDFKRLLRDKALAQGVDVTKVNAK